MPSLASLSFASGSGKEEKQVHGEVNQVFLCSLRSPPSLRERAWLFLGYKVRLVRAFCLEVVDTTPTAAIFFSETDHQLM